MSIFKKLFGRTEKTKSQQTNKALESNEELNEKVESMKQMQVPPNSPEQFKNELYDSFSRYCSNPELRIELNLTHSDGNVYQEHEAFGGTFAQWQQVQSIWDRRSILFQLWDATEFDKLEKWQVIERLTKDRYALKAIEFEKASITTDDFQDVRLIVAMSKLYRAMDSYDSALHYSKTAYELRPDLDIVKIEYANVLHLSKEIVDKELAHKLFNEVLEKKVEAAGEKKVALLNYFMFSPNYIDSSVFSVLFLYEGQCDLETWETIAGEYYWCPYFRYEHAVYLNSKGESLRALAKLISLGNEFPWHKTSVLASIDTIQQFRDQRKDQNFMSEEMKQLEEYTKMWNN